MTPDFEAQLRAASLRVTRPRLAVLAALHDHPHVDTDTVIALVRRDHPMVSHGHAPCLTASEDHGFVIDEAEVVYWGACPDCSEGN